VSSPSWESFFKKIEAAIQSERYLVSWHADERCGERGVSDWQIIAGFADAELLRERPKSKPNPSVVVRQQLADGTEVEAIWSYLGASERDAGDGLFQRVKGV
jgi:hypothetical protein